MAGEGRGEERRVEEGEGGGGRRKEGEVCVEGWGGVCGGRGRGMSGGGGRGVCRREWMGVWRRVGEWCAKKEGEADREVCGIDGRKSVEWEGSEGEQEGTCRNDWREITS